jgi:hypothetical protein
LPPPSPDPVTNSSALSLSTPQNAKVDNQLPETKASKATALVKLDAAHATALSPSPQNSAALGMRPGSAQRAEQMATMNLDSARMTALSEGRNSDLSYVAPEASSLAEGEPSSASSRPLSQARVRNQSTLSTLTECENQSEVDKSSKSLSKLSEATIKSNMALQKAPAERKNIMERFRGMFQSKDPSKGSTQINSAPDQLPPELTMSSNERDARDASENGSIISVIDVSELAHPPNIPFHPSNDGPAPQMSSTEEESSLALLSRLHHSNEEKSQQQTLQPAPASSSNARRASAVMFESHPVSSEVSPSGGSASGWRGALEIARRSLTPLSGGGAGPSKPSPSVLRKKSAGGLVEVSSWTIDLVPLRHHTLLLSIRRIHCGGLL